MKLNSKIILAVCVLAFTALVYWRWPAFQERYFPKEKPTASEKISQPAVTSELTEESEAEDVLDFENETLDEPVDESTPADDEEAESVPVEEEEAFEPVTQKDCENKCVDFNDADELKYCREFCNLNQKTETKFSSECADQEGLEIDYCYKDLAISKKDFKICDRVSDAGIKETCQNRVTEDILDEQNTELE